MSEVNTWSVTAASNNSAVPDGWPENMARSGVNNSARENMATIRRWQADTNGSLASAGTANAQTLAVNRTTTTAYTGEEITFRAGAALTNTGAVTVNITPSGGAARGTVAVQKNGAALVGGEIVAGGVYTIVYDGTVYQLANAQDFQRGPDGTVSAPGFAFAADLNTGLYRPAADQIAFALGGVQAALFEAAGLTLKQAGNDTAIFSRESTDVTHGRTTLAPTSVYGWDQKIDATLGGLQIAGITDTTAGYALRLVGYADSPDTVHTTAAIGVVEAYAATVSGTDVANIGADSNLFVVKSRAGGAWVAEFIVDQGGELLARTGGVSPTDFADYNDTAWVRSFNDFLGMDRDRPDFDRMAKLADMKFLGRVSPEQWEKGERPLWCVTKVIQLHNGWMVQAVERERIRDEVIEEMLPGFLAKIEERAIGRNVGGIPALMER